MPAPGPPADGHVHTEWSWDARRVGDMRATCEAAVARGLPAVAFTEHVDFTPFRAGSLPGHYPEMAAFVTDGVLQAPPLDVDGYLESVDRCRAAFGQLRILTGVEVGQPHRHPREVADLLAGGRFDRVLGSLHCLPDGDSFAEPWELFRHRPPAEVFRDYLAEIPRLVSGSAAFGALAHLDYPVRSWPAGSAPFDPRDFEDDLRHALEALAGAGRALEINTRLPLHPLILRWWAQEGGRLVTFGSDAHRPADVGHGLAEAGERARSAGFRPDRNPAAPWFLR
ncbi:PHP domain-containing protein [Kineosporia succinea]|uniref:Histidinol-phosphatase n=1 Tax=Kineosporia succinea TaxID=84632 RepID=A0ABT9PC27_9ACTN|nr:PHP domain-containing protein [Kineosporia succinea]MDP9830056.1 histidinol-phosphatase (PHP family) [Kineosporia succinea]